MSLENPLKRPHQKAYSVISHKVFVRSSKAGNATKLYREQYLRTDIPCSSALCDLCAGITPTLPDGSVQLPILARDPNSTSKRGPHYLVIDTNIALRAIDALELKSAFFDIIIPQTVLEEVRNRSLPVYQRLRNLSKDADEKRIYVFHNEFRQETHIVREKNETINDRNDRAIRKVVEFYNNHLAAHATALSKELNVSIPQVILLSEDKANRQKAQAEGITALSIREYISELPNSDEILDMLPSEEDTSKSSENQFEYPEYYPQSRVLGGVKNNTLFRGKLEINRYNFLEGTVSTRAYPRPILILGRKNLNRGFNGDTVVVELLPKSQWKYPSSEVIEEEKLDQLDGADNEDEFIISEAERKMLSQEALKAQEAVNKKSDEEEVPALRIQPTARIVAIEKRSWRFYVGHIPSNSVTVDDTNSLKNVFVSPLDKCIPRIRIRTRKAQELMGKRLVVAIDSWSRTSKHPDGHFVRALGDIETKEAETEALLLEHDVEYRPFSKAVLKCLPPEGHDWKCPEKLQGSGDPKLEKRRDLRHLDVCSIDPPRCQDIDDALHARPLPNGNYEVGVHIADVTHFVKPNTPLDEEGSRRGTSVYLVDKRIDMLPMLLGTDLCSLIPRVDRFAFSVLWELSPDAKIVNVEFTKSVIRSREAFEYGEAQARIDDASNNDDLTKGMRILLDLSIKLKQQRMDAGALNLASPEVKVHTDSETSDPSEVEIKQLLATNSLVEEFMLLANISVARQIYQAFPQTAMLRRHGAPPATNFDVLNEQLRVKKGSEFHIDTSSSKALADSLDKLVDPKDPFFNTLVRIMATRCMMAAEYFSSGSYSEPEFRHYGLATEIYTHFTSPIRRYADVVAHRQLAASISYEPLDQVHRDKEKMERVCFNINKRHRNAQFAGRASIEYYVGQLLKREGSDATSVTHEGYIIKVFSNGVSILVPKFGVESLIHLEGLGDPETARYVEETFTLEIERTDSKTGKRQVRALSVFDRIMVSVHSVKDESSGKRKVQMQLAD
ncbi:uncharacterized protein SAPINGB_P002982 [Magnusiomyces paraingens]|uniref:Ribosomal RNA-processing protein 44 n=1 Tax=Magnusiomyces paraingens TaxID=2606893 RepID=A0A5E8BNK7_9ASCO|nr:uncharacterized protein SAPINGB_P002982 [Saprochaete ingens]VVT51095.1 unnamed protein product [Saprochaete ingens]